MKTTDLPRFRPAMRTLKMATGGGGFVVRPRFLIEAKCGRRWVPLGAPDAERAWMFETAKERNEKLTALESERSNGAKLSDAYWLTQGVANETDVSASRRSLQRRG